MKIGDVVAVLDDVVRGIVTKINQDAIEIKDDTGMFFNYHVSELVKIEKDQNELAKFSDINNPLLKSKIQASSQKKKTFSTTKNEHILEVDLHMSKLLKSTKGLDNYDMLNIQIDTAKRKLEFAIQKRMSKIVFIHGVGEGVLKTELKFLFNRYPVKYYDANYQKYGLGATEVYILQNPN